MTTPTHPSSSSSEAPASAPATPPTNPNQVKTMYRPLPVIEPMRVSAGLCLANTADAAMRLPGDIDLMEQLAESIKAELILDEHLVNRLFQLWNGALQLEVDELGDWSLKASASLRCVDEASLPDLMAIGATVYASGDVAFFLQLQGVEAPLWFAEQLDLAGLAEGHEFNA